MRPVRGRRQRVAMAPGMVPAGAAAAAAPPPPAGQPAATDRRAGRSGGKRRAAGPAAEEPPPGRRRSARVRGDPPAVAPLEASPPCRRPARPTLPPSSPPLLAPSAHVAGVWPGLLHLPTDLLLRLGGQLPPADLFALAGSCKTARAALGRGAWVRLFECVCLPTRAAPAKGAEVASPASPAGAVGPPRPLVGPDEDPRRWHLGRHAFSAAAAEAEARRIVALVSAVAAESGAGLMARVDVRAQLRVAVTAGWSVYAGLSLPLVLASSRVTPATAGRGALVYQVLPMAAARRFWHVTDRHFARPPVDGVGVPNAAALAAERRTVGGLVRAAVRAYGGVAELLKSAARIQERAARVAARAAANRAVVDALAAERRLHRFPGAAHVACESVGTLKRFVTGDRGAEGAAALARVTTALDAVTAAYEALSPPFLYRLLCQDGESRLWLNERHQYGWPACLQRCAAAPPGDAAGIAVDYEKATTAHL